MADGGLTALGTNITLMGLVGVWVGWLVFRAAQSVLPKRRLDGRAAAAAAALVSVPLAALAFVGLFAVGGQVPIPLDRWPRPWSAVHVLIGLGEAAITALAVSARRRGAPRPRPRRPAGPGEP